MIRRLLADGRDLLYAMLAMREVIRTQGEIERRVGALEDRVCDIDAVVNEMYTGEREELPS